MQESCVVEPCCHVIFPAVFLWGMRSLVQIKQPHVC